MRGRQTAVGEAEHLVNGGRIDRAVGDQQYGPPGDRAEGGAVCWISLRALRPLAGSGGVYGAGMTIPFDQREVVVDSAQIAQLWVHHSHRRLGPVAAPNGGYLKPSLRMPHLTRTSAALTCS